MEKTDQPVTETVRTVVANVLAGRGLELVHLDILLKGGHPFIRIFADKEGGITLEDCASATREISVHLYVEDGLPNGVNIEVSSPGIDRPLITNRDFERNLNRFVEVRYQADGKICSYTGRLTESAGGSITLSAAKGALQIERSSIVTARQSISF